MMDRDTKLIAILRRQYHIILTALGENIFRQYNVVLPSQNRNLFILKQNFVDTRELTIPLHYLGLH